MAEKPINNTDASGLPNEDIEILKQDAAIYGQWFIITDQDGKNPRRISPMDVYKNPVEKRNG